MNFRKVLPLAMLALASFLPDAGAAFSARHNHTTTLLADGNILITGGIIDAGNTTTNSVQMYNMATNLYDPWGNLAAPRYSHTATLMSDGRILIAGGFDSSGTPLSSLEVCDPIAKTCATQAAVLSPAKGGHTATLLSKGTGKAGRVLLCGGQSAIAPTSITEDCDLFNPADATVSNAAPMVSQRMGHAAVLLRSGRVFVTGGRRWNQAGTDWLYEPMNEAYDPVADTWIPKEALNQGRIDHSATVLNNGMIMVAGGYNYQPYNNCKNKVGEECWTAQDVKYWGYGVANQDMGSHGYLDGTEYFDQNGGRAVIGESSYGVTPYRVSKHSAVLLPDGSWNMQGGYGGIVRTMFTAAPSLEDGTVFYLSKTGNTTADLLANSGSIVKFPVITTLARPVSGRLVDADAFFSQPLKPAENPSVTVENVKLYLDHSTAALDGFPVGTLLGPDYLPGDFDYILKLWKPTGRAVFVPQSMNSDSSQDTDLKVTAASLIFPTLFLLDPPAKITGGSITAWVSMILPAAYRGIKGLATIKGGLITDTADQEWSISLNSGGTAAVDVHDPVAGSCDEVGQVCTFKTQITIPVVTGIITNLTVDTTIYSSEDITGSAINLSFDLAYTADEIWTGTIKPSFEYGRSDMVIREMIFSSALGFIPKTNTWKDLTDLNVSPTLAEPVFNHTALVTPAADTLIMGGRNCEASTDTYCLRDIQTFTARSSGTVVIPVNTTWSDSEKLNSKRAYHTSTMLSTGQILTCGGSNGSSPLATCELMDPDTKKWSPTGSMNYARTRHTATLLPNGNVLVAGGATPSSAAVNTAEIYYPDTQRWVPTLSMAEVRQNHTATLLPDGNVLVAGGATLNAYSPSAEIFNTAKNTWAYASGPMTYGRSQHTATLLKSGNVLMAGGVNSYGAVKQTEVYNYLAKTFASGGNLSTARYAHTATLLRDGRVLVIGGSNNVISQLTAEIYTDGSGWADPIGLDGNPALLNYDRANHRSVLLPNGKIMVTGGEAPGAAQSRTESYDPDFPSWTYQGETTPRSHHTSVLTKDNYLLNIGGWDGSKYLETTDIAYFSYSPDIDGLEAEIARQPAIASGTIKDSYFDRGATVTLLSDTSNFHGITEASGGSAGPVNSSAGNPRIYMQQIDNPSGFMIDLSNRIYSWYGGPNTSSNWEKTLSSMTVVMPSDAGSLPHGWYHMRVAANGQFSSAHTVQVTLLKPTGMTSALSGQVLGSTSVQWTWTNNDLANSDGYAIFASSNGVYLDRMDLTSSATYIQTGLLPNSAAAIMVGGYNAGGYSLVFQRSPTVYTYAATPKNLTVDHASFVNATLSWDPNSNSPQTIYELSMSKGDSNFLLNISTPIQFNNQWTSTSAAISQLTPGDRYYFRVRARNLAGVVTAYSDYSNYPSTITVSDITNLQGNSDTMSTINWSWDKATGANSYEAYDFTAGTTSVAFTTTTLTGLTQRNLKTNSAYIVAVNAVMTSGSVRGPIAVSSSAIYTRAEQPGSGSFGADIGTGTLTVNWNANSNPPLTRYLIYISTIIPFSPIGCSSYTLTSSSSPNLSFALSGLIPNTQYSVRLAALNGDDIPTDPNDSSSPRTLAQAPTNLRLLGKSISGVKLAWDSGDNPARTEYSICGTNTLDSNGNMTDVKCPAGFNKYADNTVFINSLLTETTYYFSISAINDDSKETGSTRSEAVYTPAGPDNAPNGSLGGTSQPGTDVTIEGMLLNGTSVSLLVPAGAFKSPTQIAISQSVTGGCSDPDCAPYVINGTTVGVTIYTQDVQPQVPVTLKISYANDFPDSALKNLVLARYTDTDCLPLETQIAKCVTFAAKETWNRCITAKLNHFSVFKLKTNTVHSDLNSVRVYPNPFRPRDWSSMTIDGLPASSGIKIYTLSGDKVWEGTANAAGVLTWNAVNNSGVLVGSGIYLAAIESGAGKKVIKIAVER